MGDISNNFNRSEFKCQCGKCNQNTVDARLITVLERLRVEFKGKPIKINSGNRCANHNKSVGGRANSYHLVSKAADIVVQGVESFEVYTMLNEMYPSSLGLGRYKTFTHVDVRNSKARW